MDSYDLNEGHKIRYWDGEGDAAEVLSSMAEFLVKNGVQNVSSAQLELHWNPDAKALNYEARLIYGGF